MVVQRAVDLKIDEIPVEEVIAIIAQGCRNLASLIIQDKGIEDTAFLYF